MSKFEIIDTSVEFKGKAFEVHRLNMRLPDGRTHLFELVQHRDSVSIMPIDADRNLLFVSQHRVGAGRDLLELPAGVLEAGEDPQIGAEREVREETGMAARKLRQVGSAYLAPGYATELMYFFLAEDLYPAPLAQDVDEFIELVKIPIVEAYRMAKAGDIHDSKTLAALLLAEKYVG
jgi:ADP-ribose pyrophosphatase